MFSSFFQFPSQTSAVVDVYPPDTTFICPRINVALQDTITYPVFSYPKALTDTVKKMAKVVNSTFKGKEIVFYCRGSSGVAVASMLCLLVQDSRVVYIRKEDDDSHAMGNISGNIPAVRSSCHNIIVDDFICTGGTLRTIAQKLYEKQIPIDAVLMLWKPDIAESVHANDFKEAFYALDPPKLYICGDRRY
jgi:orotate phosphoribosyltransferase